MTPSFPGTAQILTITPMVCFCKAHWTLVKATIRKNLYRKFQAKVLKLQCRTYSKGKKLKFFSTLSSSPLKTTLNSNVIFSVTWRPTLPVVGWGEGQWNCVMCCYNPITWQSLISCCLDCGLIDGWHSWLVKWSMIGLIDGLMPQTFRWLIHWLADRFVDGWLEWLIA